MKKFCVVALALIAIALLLGITVSAGSTATDLLLAKARSLEGRGRLDLAAQSWQQVLMADPNQPEALAGLARWAKQNGRAEESQQYLNRLRAVAPNDPAIARIEDLKVIGPKQRARLDEAGRLAAAHQYDDSMRIYREVLGDEPPPGNWAIAYYETDAATPDGYQPAVAGLRRLAQRFPADMQYRLCLGRLLTYRPGTRLEGVRLLATIPPNSSESKPAREAWRQALVWEGPTAASASLLKDYLKRYPDPELGASLEKAEQTQTGVADMARTREQQLGYAALNANNLPEAEAQFRAELKRDPKSSAALAGLGYVRLKQQDFSGAIEYFEQAKAAAPSDSRIATSLETARFWEAMQQGNEALASNQLVLAQSYFQQAVAMRPKNAEAIQAYAGTLMKQGNAAQAVPLYRQITDKSPDNADAWRGLLRAQLQSGENAAAADTIARIPARVKASLSREFDFLVLEASVYFAAGQDDEAQKLIQQAILVANSQPRNTSIDIRLQLAGLLLQIGQTRQAVGIYQQVADMHPDNVDAWQGLVAAYLRQNDPPRAIAVLQRIPKATYNVAIQDPGFLLSIASVYKVQNEYETADEFVQRAIQIESKGGGQPNVTTQIELAKIWLAEGRNDEANNLFRTLVEKNPENLEAWKGYIAALHQQKNDEAAIAQSEQLPEAVAQRLKNDPGFLSLMASVNSSLGRYDESLRLLKQAMFHYELARQPIPVDMQLQLGWLLLDSHSDERELYSLLVTCTARRDLSAQQRHDFEDIWSAWSLRQADAARQAGDTEREIAILEAALKAIPNDNHIRGALAGALLTNGDAHRAYALYKAWGLKGADVNDYRGAIGAAMTVHEDPQGQMWMKEALRLWPEDPEVLMLAARTAQEQGDFEKAKRYWQAALRSLPPGQAQLPPHGYASAASPDGRSLQELARTLMPGGQLPEAGSPSKAIAPLTVIPAQPLTLPPPSGQQAQITPPVPARKPKAYQQNSRVRTAAPSRPANTPTGSLAPNIQPISHVTYEPGGSTEYADGPQISNLFPSDPIQQEAASLPPPSAVMTEYSGENYAPASTTSAQTPAAGQQSERDEIEAQIAAIAGRNSPFAGMGGLVSNRSGTAGFERLMDQEASLEGSVVFNDSVRVTAVVRPVFLDAGTPDGTSTYRFGSAPVGTIFPAQSASGLAGELQVSTENFGLRLGASPAGFPIYNWLGGLRWRIDGGPITVMVNRDNVKDTMLSYAGVTDPVSGATWGAVMANSGTILGNWGGAGSGVYGSIGYQFLDGTDVASNYRLDGNAGAYWRIFARPYGALTLGVNISAMHYNKNLRFFTLGQGGYFSPQEYFLFNTPVRWVGTYKRNFEYSFTGSIGSQQFHEDPSPLYPDDPGLQAATRNQYYPAQSIIGVNYNFSFRGDYRLPANWYIGTFINFNNARDYGQQTIGFNVRYLFHETSLTPETPVPAIPDWRGFQPFRLPQ